MSLQSTLLVSAALAVFVVYPSYAGEQYVHVGVDSDRANLAGTFGAGVKLKEVTIEMTDEDVTGRIEKISGLVANC